ncbi:GerAB/ArcD/ProY family transporter [Paenibacillus cremeus]|uniref:GerAB/ArcD/ProY family transporter n=1 Tax=Paenibacillus cremeus TaxID=2163881 RepID=UPI0021BD2ED2|nr:GerAB/ArcD/ProY family transporter [Paenibacillus cremeus]
MLANGFKPVLRATADLWTFPFIETFFFCFLVTKINKNPKVASLFYKSTVLSGTAIFVVTCVSILDLGGGLTKDIVYPTYYLASTINIGNVFERVEAIMGIIWFITIFFRLTLLMYVSASGFAEAFAMQDYRTLVIPLTLIALPLSIIIWPDVVYYTDFREYWRPYAFVLGILLPLIFWFTGLVKAKLET